jgi:hypothetical protein
MKKNRTLIIALCALFIVTACDNVFQPPLNNAAPESGYGRVAVTITGASARTVLPAMAFAKYEYAFAKVTNGTPGTPVNQAPVDGYFTLEVGEWRVTVYAYAKADDTSPAASGTSDTFNVTGSAAAQATVRVAANETTGKGTFSYNIRYPAGAAITFFSLENLLTGTAAINITTANGSGTYNDIPAGMYSLTLQLEKEGRTTGANEVVYVYDKLNSAYGTADSPVVFTDDDFSFSAAGTPGLAYRLITSGANAGTYRVSSGTATGGDVVISAIYNGKPVTEIGNSAFNYFNTLTSVIIPASVTSIGDNAFGSCTSLTGITIPSSVTSIGKDAFGGCTSLTGITVAANNPNYSSEGGILYDKAKTTLIQAPPATISGNVTIPSSVTTIGDNAFFGTSLTGITFAQNSQLKTIGNSAFRSCTSLTGITIPASVTSIGDSAFSGCTSLTSVTIQEGVTSIGYQAFSGCTSLTGITIPSSVTSIGAWAFGGCSNLTSITIPSSVTSIGGGAFSSTAWLNNQSNGLIYAGKVLYTYIGTMPANTVINNIQADTVAIAGSAFSGCTGLTSITIPAGVTSIGDGAFWRCTGLPSVTIPSSVTSIGGEAFVGCTSLTGITFAPNSQLKSIGNYAFNECTNLTSVTIPAGVTSIDYWAFAECTSITSITIPSSVTSVGRYAFSRWTSSQTINIQGYASQATADAAWGANWRGSCDAVIKYQP